MMKLNCTILTAWCFALGCGGNAEPSADAATDTGPRDTSVDVRTDTGASDSATDTATTDAQTGDASTPSTQISMNAVSVLFPLGAQLLTLATVGNGGALLPSATYTALGAFNSGPLHVTYAEWQIVAARIDPCFPSMALLQTNPTMCRPQIRLVAENVTENEGAYQTADQTIHLLYDLTPTQFQDLTRRWVAPLANESGARTQAIGMSPTMQAQGLTGAYATTIFGLIREFAGTATLAQVTFMESHGNRWTFGGVRIGHGAGNALTVTPLNIPSLPNTQDTTRQGTASMGDAPFTIDPSPTATRLLRLAGMNGTGFGQWTFDTSPSARAERQDALQLTFDLGNPRAAFNPDNVDCVSCHIPHRARNRAVRVGESIAGLSGYTHPVRPMTLPTINNPDAISQLRGFGYTGRDVVIGSRAAAESAEVADWVERLVSQ